MAEMKVEVTVDKKALIMEKLREQLPGICKDAINEVKPKAISEAKMIVGLAIDAYYEAYKPDVYGRTESLYKVMHIIDSDWGFYLDFDGSDLGGHRAPGEYIYDVMFKKGYHGGAPHNDDYYWRWPSFGPSQDIGIPAFSLWYPWGPAVQTEAPWNIIQEEWNSYVNNKGKALLMNALTRRLSVLMKEVS